MRCPHTLQMRLSHGFAAIALLRSVTTDARCHITPTRKASRRSCTRSPPANPTWNSQNICPLSQTGCLRRAAVSHRFSPRLIAKVQISGQNGPRAFSGPAADTACAFSPTHGAGGHARKPAGRTRGRSLTMSCSVIQTDSRATPVRKGRRRLAAAAPIAGPGGDPFQGRRSLGIKATSSWGVVSPRCDYRALSRIPYLSRCDSHSRCIVGARR